jgi:hypothetical protein
LPPNIVPFHDTVSVPEQVAFSWMTLMVPAAPADMELVAIAT